MKRYKYRALVKLGTPPGGKSTDPPLLETGGRVVVRAHHHDTHRSKIFSALITTTHGELLQMAADHSIEVTMTVLGDDACDYLEAGDAFTLWRGQDIGQGVICCRLFLWTDS